MKSGQSGLIHEQKIRCAFLPPIEEDGNLRSLNADPGAAMETTIPPSNDSAFINGGTPSQYDNARSSHGSHSMTFVDDTSVDRSVDFVNGQTDSPSPATNYQSGYPDSMIPAIPTTTADAKSVASNVSASVPSATSVSNVASNAATSVSNAASNAATSVSNAATNAAASLGLTGSSTQPTYSRSTELPQSSNLNGNNSALQQELQSARAEIERLKGVIAQKDREANSGLRQRNIGSSEKSATVAGTDTSVMTQDGGIPLPIVGAIAAGVFVFTWSVRCAYYKG